MDIIFLDIDGVVVPLHSSFGGQVPTSALQPTPGNSLLALFAELPDFKVVLTSSWRLFMNNDQMMESIFGTHLWKAVKSRLVGATDQNVMEMTKMTIEEHGQARGDLINKYMEGHDVENYIILDDLPINLKNSILIDHRTGLTLENVSQAVAMVKQGI